MFKIKLTRRLLKNVFQNWEKYEKLGILCLAYDPEVDDWVPVIAVYGDIYTDGEKAFVCHTCSTCKREPQFDYLFQK